MATFIKMTQDGRRVEVIGSLVCLDGKPESWEVIELVAHPRRLQVLSIAPEATHIAGRIALNREEADRARQAIHIHDAQLVANPAAIARRFQNAMNQHAWTQGIE